MRACSVNYKTVIDKSIRIEWYVAVGMRNSNWMKDELHHSGRHFWLNHGPDWVEIQSHGETGDAAIGCESLRSNWRRTAGRPIDRSSRITVACLQTSDRPLIDRPVVTAAIHVEAVARPCHVRELVNPSPSRHTHTHTTNVKMFQNRWKIALLWPVPSTLVHNSQHWLKYFPSFFFWTVDSAYSGHHWLLF